MFIFTVNLQFLPEAEGEQPRLPELGSALTAGQQLLLSRAGEGDNCGATRAQAVSPGLGTEIKKHQVPVDELLQLFFCACTGGKKKPSLSALPGFSMYNFGS